MWAKVRVEVGTPAVLRVVGTTSITVKLGPSRNVEGKLIADNEVRLGRVGETERPLGILGATGNLLVAALGNEARIDHVLNAHVLVFNPDFDVFQLKQLMCRPGRSMRGLLLAKELTLTIDFVVVNLDLLEEDEEERLIDPERANARITERIVMTQTHLKRFNMHQKCTVPQESHQSHHGKLCLL